MSEKRHVREYVDDFDKYFSERWAWSLKNSIEQHDLYMSTRARRSTNPYQGNVDLLPDFYSIERDAAQFDLEEVEWQDFFGLVWEGKKGVIARAGAPNFQGNLYYYDPDNVDDEFGYCVSEIYDAYGNQPPANYYVVRFHPKKGFYLEKYSEFQMTESKIYGIHLEKVHKVLKSFEAFNRNLGVILSGDKGIGKSLFARLLGREAVNNGMPVIIVEGFIEGIGSFIDSIDQEVLVLFDEFDKTFARSRDDGVDPQASMLSLFDGVAQGKKLFVVTCNELRGLNGFLVNRPGRFHYHFRFEYPSAEDIRNYLKDKLIPEAHSEIEEVVNFSKRVALNYDCLRAIAFELNLGQDFSGAISDLNIINVEKERYRVTAKFADGTTLVNKDFYMDSFNEEDKNVYLYNCQDHYAGEITFQADAIKFNSLTGELYVDGSDVLINYDYDGDEDDEKSRKALMAKDLQQVIIHRVQSSNLHYAI